jgi:predicted dehydrogenase
MRNEKPTLNSDPAKPVIRWGILGTGTVARAFAADLRLLPDALLTSVGSRKLDRAQVFASEFGARHVHESVKHLARNDEVDVVYVATPHVRHREDCVACLADGRAILCEKPFTLNVAEGRAVVDQARASRRFCMEAMWMRFHPLILKVRSMVESGALGTIRLLTADFGYPTSFDPENRLFDRRLGGGALLDRGIYPLSLAFFLLGRPIESVGRATLGATGVDEQMAMLLSYPGGALAVLTASMRSRVRNEAVIIGTHGQIRLHSPFYAPNRMSWTRFTEPVGATLAVHSSANGWKARVKRNPLVRRALDMSGRSILSLIRRDTTSFVHYASGQGYQFEAAEVMRCLRAGLLESPVMPLDETLAILETTDALRRSWALTYPGENS